MFGLVLACAALASLVYSEEGISYALCPVIQGIIKLNLRRTVRNSRMILLNAYCSHVKLPFEIIRDFIELLPFFFDDFCKSAG